MLEGYIPSGRIGGNLFPCLLQFQEAICIPGSQPLLPSSEHLTPTSASFVPTPPPAFVFFSPSCKVPCDYIEPTQIIQVPLPISSSLTWPHQQSFTPCILTYSQVLGIEIWTFLRGGTLFNWLQRHRNILVWLLLGTTTSLSKTLNSEGAWLLTSNIDLAFCFFWCL